MPAKRPTGRKVTAASKRPARLTTAALKQTRERGAGKVLTKAAVTPGASVLLVNMIPKSLSGEENQDSEPSIAVNPANPLQIAGSAFTPDPAKGPFAPIYVSNDGGQTWTLNSIVPGGNRMTGTGDITLKFSRTNSTLYAGILRGDSKTTRLNILRTKNFAAVTPMEILVDRANVDQPYMQVGTVMKGADKGKDRIYVGTNDTSLSGSATIEQSLDGGATKPTFRKIRIESRETSGQDGPPVRPSVHPDGTAYAIYHAWRSFNRRSGAGTADIVVVRDDNGGTGPRPFRDLVDADDGKVGVRVARNTQFNFSGFLGMQRTGGDVALAVDPRDSKTVYIAYNDDQGEFYMLHVLRSLDSGKTWSADLRTVRNALNPALAINDEGKVGFLYQQLTGSGAAERWETKLEFTTDGANWNALTLAKVPAAGPARTFDPYLGDYAHLTSLGKDFYGVFSANNTPRKSNFPNGVIYQRNANWTSNTLLDVDNRSPVHPSIDPFFLKVNG
ncbi:MAG: hypothetical protein QOD75_2205 [Blastocatellia bacterium]|nr:hypothetical protein [Blastocatellia bacterium]